MKWSEILVPCANKDCENKVMHKGKMNDSNEWVPDSENACCCSEECHELHENQIKQVLKSP